MKKRNIVTTVIFAGFLGAFSVMCYFKPPQAISNSERRPLAQLEEISVESVFSTSFQSNFENYTADQFPFRDSFRKIKAISERYLLNKKDNNGLFVADGHISKIEYPLNDDMVDNAVNKFNFLYDSYIKNTDAKVYLSLVPDKNYFIAEKNGYPAIDYDTFIENVKNNLPYMNYIDILPYLDISDYYTTDSHWKQEKIVDIAEHLANEMGTNASAKYDVNTLDNPFKGVYLGQSQFVMSPDTIKYLTNKTLNECIVSYFDTGKKEEGKMYNMQKAYGKDAYEMFLSGTSALIEIENPNAKTDKELVVFRDSYASSLVPLLAEGYKKITVVDIRYIQSSFVGNFVKFTNQDVLFLYSTTLINNSMAFK
jgi:hypothetical protein